MDAVSNSSRVKFTAFVKHIETINGTLTSKTVFHLSLTSDLGDKWEAQKTFHDFVEFERNLKTLPLFKNLKIPDLQKKGGWTTSADDLLEARKKSIERWLKEFLQRNIFANEAKSFLNIPGKTRKVLSTNAEIQEDIPIFTGYMMKRGEVVKTWRRRYFTLHKSWILRYYEEKGSCTPRGNVDIKDVNKIVSYESDPDHPYSFSMNTPRRHWFFKCESREHLNIWIKHITALMQSSDKENKYQVHVEQKELAASSASVGSPVPVSVHRRSKITNSIAYPNNQASLLSETDADDFQAIEAHCLSESDLEDAAPDTLRDEVKKLKTLLNHSIQVKEENRLEWEEERRRLLEKLGAPDVKRRLSSFREQITVQDTRLEECMAELAKIEETMRLETARYKKKYEEEKLLREKLEKDLENIKEQKLENQQEANADQIAAVKKELDRTLGKLRDSQNEVLNLRRKIEEMGDVVADDEESSEVEHAKETKPGKKVKSARKMSLKENVEEKQKTFKLVDTLLKYGKGGKNKPKRKFVWFVHSEGKSYIEWSDKNEEDAGRKATVKSISVKDHLVKRQLSAQEIRRIFVIIADDGKKFVFLADSEQQRDDWYRGIAQFVPMT